jgi:pimeloyl-ACP methyl ester carboxylesterase
MDRTIQISGKKIHYRVYGNGIPVMFVHGFGETGEVWKNQVGPSGAHTKQEGPDTTNLLSAKPIKDKFRFIVPDLPGSGQSEMISDMSMEGMAEVLRTILDTEARPGAGIELNGIILIGHSMGGYVTLAYAEKYGASLRALGLFHSTAYPDSEEKKAMRRKGIEFITKHGAFEFLKTTTPNLFSAETRQERPALVSEFVQSLADFSPQALVSYYEAMMRRPDRTNVLALSPVPVLFVLGQQDTAVPLQDGLKQCHLPRKAYVHILIQSGHMGMLEETAKTNRILEQFLADLLEERILANN